MTALPAISPMQAWAEKEKLPEKSGAHKQQNDLTEIFMTMLQNVSSNPLGETDPAEGIRLIQGLVDAQSRLQERKEFTEMKEALEENNLLQASNLVGKRAQFRTNAFVLSEQHRDKIAYEVPKGANLKDVTIHLFREDGMKISELKGNMASGYHNLDKLANKLPPGRYAFQVQGVDNDNKPVTLETLVTSNVDHVLFKQGKIWAGAGQNDHMINQLKGLYPGGDILASAPLLTEIASHA